MFTTCRFAIPLWLMLFAFAVASAQTERDSRQPSPPTVTASAKANTVRLAALGETVQMRLEVYDSIGAQVFDSGFRPGGVLDWNVSDGASSLPDGAYLCVVTYKDLTGRLRQKMCSVSVTSGQASLSRLDKEQVTPMQAQALSASRQQQAIEPTEGDEALTILTDVTPPVAVVTHDGQDGRVVSATGALSFRTGDLFSGKDVERMRITEDGRVGIGVEKPEATLDVAGTLRVSRGIEFSDGTVQTTGLNGRRNAEGEVVSNATGTGTTGKLAKWTNGSAGQLGNSIVTESNSNIGIGTASPGAKLDVVGAINTNMQYNIAGARVLSVAGSANTFTGIDAGLSNTGNSNAFFGRQAGFKNTTGSYNSFFGRQAGYNNTTGNDSSFFGWSAGLSNIASGNSFFGKLAGYLNTTGENNSFFGTSAGDSNTTGNFNSFFGREAGAANTTGGANDFFGYRAGTQSTGGLNSFFGAFAGQLNTTGSRNSFFGFSAGSGNKTGSHNTLIGYDTNVSANNLVYATAIGAEAVVNASNTIVLGRVNGSDNVRVPGTLTIQTLHVAGGQPLCLNALNRVAACSSSRRYKTAIQPFTGGLDLIRRLRPITFTWREGRSRDLGFGAEDVEAVEPLLVTRNTAGEIEGVKYAQLSAVLVNAVREQQAQITAHQQTITELRQQNARLQAHLQEQESRLAALEQAVKVNGTGGQTERRASQNRNQRRRDRR